MIYLAFVGWRVGRTTKMSEMGPKDSFGLLGDLRWFFGSLI